MSEEELIPEKEEINNPETRAKSDENYEQAIKYNVKKIESLVDEFREILSSLSSKLQKHENNLTDASSKLEEEVLMLRYFPEDTSKKIASLSPIIAKEVVGLLQGTMREAFDSEIQHCNTQLKALSSYIIDITEHMQVLKTSSFRRILLNLGALLLISVLSSAGVSYFMMQYFPQRISIDASGDISVKDSQVHMWGKEGIKKHIK